MLKKFKIKLLSFFIITLLAFIIQPVKAQAVNENISVVNIQKNEYIIYIKDYTDKQFKYSFTNNDNSKETELSYINSISDLEGNQGAFFDEETYQKLKGKTIYLWAKDENNNFILTGTQIDLTNSLTKENIGITENTTKRIAVEIAKSKETTNSTKPVRTEKVNGIKETAKSGYIKITDSKNAMYYYKRVKTTDSEDYSKLMKLAEEINNKYSGMDIYEKIQANKEFYNLYSKLINEVDWQEVKDMEVKQPESARLSNGVGDKYIVFLKKVSQNGEQITDAQFLQEYYDYEPITKKDKIETIETQATSSLPLKYLPLTYDSIMLIVALAIVVVALIVIFIRMKKASKKI